MALENPFLSQGHRISFNILVSLGTQINLTWVPEPKYNLNTINYAYPAPRNKPNGLIWMERLHRIVLHLNKKEKGTV